MSASESTQSIDTDSQTTSDGDTVGKGPSLTSGVVQGTSHVETSPPPAMSARVVGAAAVGWVTVGLDADWQEARFGAVFGLVVVGLDLDLAFLGLDLGSDLDLGFGVAVALTVGDTAGNVWLRAMSGCSHGAGPGFKRPSRVRCPDGVMTSFTMLTVCGLSLDYILGTTHGR